MCLPNKPLSRHSSMAWGTVTLDLHSSLLFSPYFESHAVSTRWRQTQGQATWDLWSCAFPLVEEVDQTVSGILAYATASLNNRGTTRRGMCLGNPCLVFTSWCLDQREFRGRMEITAECPWLLQPLRFLGQPVCCGIWATWSNQKIFPASF